ncbi:hypothetical protein E0765_04715 [Sulfuricurvum sp. IAE1]|uniref:hypothetical protein n=1 Tax=Sulfuricurvum sp. IAE1 TaxID=2546102 RepID=UPI00104ECEF9|nr:hypothetical protein [Sulfuricurvum sp. IAE1]TDA65787.1 hypothetical protein E0765_04715 [Sulfuricurvum sp. IAE1]
MSDTTKETLYSFSVIYGEGESNLGLFYQESHTKSSLAEEDTSIEDILTKMLEEMKPLKVQVIDGRLMVVRESHRFTFTEDLEGDCRYAMAILPGEDEEQINVSPNITEEAGHGMRPFWYDGSGMRKVSDFDNFVEVFGTDDEFFQEVKAIAASEDLVFFPQYLCLDEQEVDPTTLIPHVSEVKVVTK